VKFTYIGDPNDDFSGPSELTTGGMTFAKGEPTTIEDTPENADLIRRLKGHSHFAGDGDALPDDAARAKKMSLDELRAILDDRNVEYKKNEGRAALATKIVESGGFPGADDAD
jgi:hypothetical protein